MCSLQRTTNIHLNQQNLQITHLFAASNIRLPVLDSQLHLVSFQDHSFCEQYSTTGCNRAIIFASANLRGVNLYVFHASLTDFHCFDWLMYVRGNPYGFIFKKKQKIFFFFLTLFFIFCCFNPRDLHELSIKMAFVETCLP